MTTLLDEVIDAHGGLHRWKAVRALRATVSLAGPFWDVRAVPAALRTDVTVDVQMHEQLVSLNRWTDTVHRFVLRTDPEVATMTAEDLHEVQVRRDPRASFPAGTDARWDTMQANYFMGYALWNYLTTPYLLSHPGVETMELEPWHDDRAPWRRLGVHFPPGIATHSTRQVFYFDSAGLLRRLDYDVEVSADGQAAHYVDDYVDVDGLKFPTRRWIYPRQPDNTPDRRTFTGSHGSLIDVTIADIVLRR
jgi:hypothetical protein